MIYFVQAEIGGPIKIGYTSATNATSRLRELQCGSPVKLCLLGTRPGGRRDEKALHDLFAHLRVHGEWFEPATDLLEHLGRAPVEAPTITIDGPRVPAGGFDSGMYGWVGPLQRRHQLVFDELDPHKWKTARAIASVGSMTAQSCAGALRHLRRLGRVERRQSFFPSGSFPGAGQTVNEYRRVQ